MFDADGYTEQLQQLLPPGLAWPRDADAGLTALLGALAEELARVDARADALVEEADPRTALELLPDWERVVGLPDPCVGAIAATVPERRAAIVARLTARGGQSIPYLTGLAASLGYAIAITEYQPTRAGTFRAGDPLRGQPQWAFVFRIDVLPPPALPGTVDPTTGQAAFADVEVKIVRMRAGQFRAGDRIVAYGSTAIECVLRRVIPAHTHAVFTYPASDPPVFDFDFTAQG